MISAQPIRLQVRAILRNQLINGDFRPSSIISPADLAKQLEVSQTPVREALIELARDGFLTNEPNRGFVVQPLELSEAAEIYPLLWALETMALREAPPGADRLDRLVQINTEYTVAEGQKLVELDQKWHTELLGECRNQTLLSLIENLRWRACRYEVGFLKRSRWSPQAPVQHHAMILALRRADVNRAAELLELNWKIGLELVSSKPE